MLNLKFCKFGNIHCAVIFANLIFYAFKIRGILRVCEESGGGGFTVCTLAVCFRDVVNGG